MDSDDKMFFPAIPISSSAPIPSGSSTTSSFDPSSVFSYSDPFYSTGFDSMTSSNINVNFQGFSSPPPPTIPSIPAVFASESEVEKKPQPLECLQGTPIPPFLSKTYDLVEDPNLDMIISWGSRGESFVIWDPVDFARLVLPRNFKHNNFSSFGFRKVDPDKWEFANEGFLRESRHLLKNIHRRKSTQSQQLTSYGGSSSSESGIGSEIEKLKKEKSALMQEVVELQEQQRGTAEHVERVKDKIQASEQRQKQMVSFLAKVLQNPVFVDRLKQMKEQRSIVSPRTRRNFLKQAHQEAGSSGTSLEGQIVKYKPEFEELRDFPSSDIPMTSAQDYLLQDVMGMSSSGALSLPFQSEVVTLNESATAQEFMDIPRSVGAGLSSAGLGDPFSRGKQVTTAHSEAARDYFVSFPEELIRQKTFPEFSSAAIGNIKQEEVWSMGFDLSTDVSSSSPAFWGNVASYDIPDVGTSCPGEFSDVFDLASLQAGGTGIENWLDDDSSPGHPENQGFESKDNIPRTNS
uniref:HSF-type DNA-binding domain-containing protein n=1 Tax=Chenopodium quinoa TaxID=63459 RepID=A0A803MQM8_CHEQI